MKDSLSRPEVFDQSLFHKINKKITVHGKDDFLCGNSVQRDLVVRHVVSYRAVSNGLDGIGFIHDDRRAVGGSDGNRSGCDFCCKGRPGDEDSKQTQDDRKNDHERMCCDFFHMISSFISNGISVLKTFDKNFTRDFPREWFYNRILDGKTKLRLRCGFP